MKKFVLWVISLVTVFSLVGCAEKEVEKPEGSNQVVEENSSVGNDVNSNYIVLKYTSVESLKNEGLVPESTVIGQYYDIGRVKLGGQEYVVKYIKTDREADVDGENTIVNDETIVLFEGDTAKKEILIGTDLWYGEYTKEISTFKDKYLVTVSETNTGDSMQFIEIDNEDMSELLHLQVHHGYENYYSISDNEITYIYTDGNEKVTSKVMEEDDVLVIQEINRSTEGVIEYAGRS